MAAFTSNIDITSGGTYNMNVTNGEPASQVATDLNGKFANIQKYLQNGLPEVWTGSSLPDSLPDGKIIFSNNVMYAGNSSGQASGTVGFTFKVTFASDFSGKTWTLTGGSTSLSGSVPTGLYTEITVQTLSTAFTLSCNGYSLTMTSGDFYGYAAYTLNAVSTTFGDNTWAVISNVSKSGSASSLWNVGDYKQITVSGTVGNQSINTSVRVFILGFDHNSSVEGTNLIHLQLGKNTSGVQIAFCDSKYNSTVSTTGYFSMNSSNTNVGGWNSSQMKSTILHSGSAPTSPGTNTLMAALPSDLRAVMRSCTKWTDNTGGGTNTSSNVTATTEYLPLLAEYEVFGARSYANSYEQNHQKQYDYYKAGNSKVFYGAGAQGSSVAVYWWLRSPYCNSSHGFCDVHTDGSANTSAANGSFGVAAGLFV